MHFDNQIRLAFKANPRQRRQCDVAVFHAHTIRESTIRLEQIGVGLVATETKARRNRERHLVTAVRHAATR